MMNLLIGGALIGLIITRQMKKTAVKEKWAAQIVLAILGATQFYQAIKLAGVINSSALIFALLGSLVIAGGMALVRAPLYQLSVEDGQVFRQGGVGAGIMWLVTVALHLGYDQLIGALHIVGFTAVASPSLLLYLAVSLGMQKYLVLQRANRINHVAVQFWFKMDAKHN